MAAPKRPLAKPDQDKPKYIDPFVYGDSGRRIIISPGTNPITQLGQTAGSKFREYEDDDLNIGGMYLPPQTVNEIEYEGGDAPPESRSAQFFAEKHPDKDPLQIDDIMITLNGVENNQTAIHEFMHRGFERLRNAYDRDEIESRFDRSVANILFEPDYEHYLVQSVLEDEGIESTNNYTENVTKSSKEKLAKTVEALNELASDEMGMLGFQTEKDSGPKTRPKRKPKKEKKSFFRRLFNFSEGGDVSPLNPKARPRTKTEEKTLRGRPVWIDHTGEVTGEKGSKYSEITTTIPWGTEWITAPSIDENGKRLSDDEVKQRLLKTRGKDFITGEELPTFSNPEKASEYAMWRSDTMFDQEAIEQGFPEEFPMEPEPERKDFIDRSIDKGKDFLEYLTTPSKHGVFNQGGAVMNEQMEMAFMQQGGLKDDGMNQDPVSGNEIPSGSMAKEVRDDISAFISEGEYVVPADVVRYLGVKHFEDLRDKAKQGLQSMEANGRIGGEPVPVGGPQAAPMMPQPQMAMGGDLSPDEMNEINSIMMAQGGMVPTDPYQQQQMQYTQPMAQGLNVGGTVTQPPAVPEIPQVSPYSSTPSGGFSWENSVSITETEVPVEDEDSCKAKGKVFNSITGMCEEPETPLVETPVVGGDDSDGPTIPPTGTQTEGTFGFGTFGQGVDWTDPEQAIEFINGEYTPIDPATRKAVVGAGMIIGGPAALLSGAATTYDALEDISSLRASVIIAKAFGNTAAEQHAQAKLEDYLAQAPGVASGVFGDWLAPGTGKAENLFKTLGVNLSGNPEEWKNQQEELQKLRDNFKKKKSSAPEPTRSDDDRPTVVPGTPPPSAAGTGGGARPPRRPTGDDPGPSGAEVAAKASQASTATPASRAKAMSAARQKGGVSAPTAAKLSGSQMKAGSGVGSGAGGANYAGPMNKGGLMLKKKKK